jgi:high-affinity iron transporter
VKTIFKFICATLIVAAAGPALAERNPAEQLAAMAGYIAADYPGAVADGRIKSQSEYDEQRAMLDEARALATRVQPLAGHANSAAEKLAALDKTFTDKAPEADVAAASRALLRVLVDDYGLVLSPLAPPSKARAETVFAQSCASCHGADGRADTPMAKTLKPPPLSFFDDERMSRLSPQVAYQALTFGVAGTAMTSFESLPASDRWSLAFYVISLRHPDAPTGEAAFRSAKPPLSPTPSRLAELSDAQLDTTLAAITDTTQRRAAIDWLRRGASFAPSTGGTFAEARRLLAEVAAHAAEPKRARELVVAAYLEGVEPHEASLRARDAAVCDRVETAFAALRHATERNAPPDEIRREVARTTVVLDGADERPAAAGVPFFAAFTIALREGFELSLLLAALLAFLRKSGRSELARYVHYGWLAAVPAGALTWFAVGALLGGAHRELAEGLLTLAAAAMLLFVSHFVLGRAEARKWLKFLERRTTTAARAAIPWPLVSVAFVAAFREAVEIVLFFKALVLDSEGGALWVLGGAAAGVTTLAALVMAMNRLGRRLNPRPVMTASSILLSAIAVSLVGQGIRALQEGGYLRLSPIGAGTWKVGLLGLYPTIEGIAAQVIVVLLILVPVLLEKMRSKPPNVQAPSSASRQ